MNGLSLRVSTVKGNENLKKNSEIRLEILKPPATSKIVEFKSFVDAKTVEDQLNCIRKIGNDLKKIEDQTKVRQIIEVLTEIYYTSPIKHGVRNLIVKSFGQQPENAIIIDCVSKALKDSIENSINASATIVRMAACLENFKCGVLAVEQCLPEIFLFVKTVIIEFVAELRTTTSPAGKNEVSLNIHNVIRFIIACLHYFIEKCSTDSTIQEEITIMYHTCYSLLENKDLPMDTKTNSGILVVLKCIIFKEDFRHLINAEDSSEKKLCLCIGIISCLDKSFFASTENFSILTDVAKTLDQIGREFAVEPSIILGVSRGYVQASKKLLVLKLEPSLFTANSSTFNDFLRICLYYSLTNLEHYMDSIRHLCRDLLINVIKLSKKYDEQFLDDVFQHALIETSDSFNKNVQCMVLANLGVALSIKDIILRIPDVVPNLLMLLEPENSNNINLHVMTSYEILMNTHFSEIGVDIWTQYWVKPLVLALNSESNSEIKQSLENLIKKAVKISPTIVFNIVQFQTTSSNSNVVLACLGQAKKCGMFDAIESNELMWKCILTFNNIRESMVSDVDEVRLSALRLITDCHRTTERMPNAELDCILHFLKYNINAQNPATRQQLMSCMRNCLLRVAATLQTVANKDRAALAQHEYQTFLLKLHHFCIDNLFIGANFSRRTLSFKILLLTSQIFQDIGEIDNIWSLKQIEMLVNCLEDTYEANAQMCVEVLKFVPKYYFSNTHINEKLIETLANSVKPADSVTAAYYLEFLAIIYPSENNFKQPDVDEKTSAHFTEIYRAIVWCEQLLLKALKVAQQSLLRAARESPLYGLIFCVRHLLSKVDMTVICQCEAWRQLFARLITLSKSLSEVVSPIVNNSSPEGHLPNDFGDIAQHIQEDVTTESCNGESVDKTLATTPQMVLLSAWRTIKEVSLLLGDIAFKSPIIRDYTQANTNFKQVEDVIGLLSVEQVLDIFNFFTKLLSETKHRGAFEQAYVGFSRLCIRLWGANEQKLHELPMQWLSDLLKLISGDDDDEQRLISTEKICATRRSAGVPYMIQALITSELQVCASTGLQFCMSSLIMLCKTGKTEEARTHALNILRALVRCTDLGDAIGEFVSEGMECAIRGYGAETWPERNSSTLLFSALMVRVFGVQRTKDSENLTIRNKMTGRIFFLRYPHLYDFFLSELKEASQRVVGGAKSLKIHPMLLLLSRLYPSSLEGSESNLKLIEFLPLVSMCSGCSEIQTRYLSAKFIAVIIAPHMIVDRIISILKIIVYNSSETDQVNLNSVHGALLQILYLLRSPKSENIKSEEYLKIYAELLNVYQYFKSNPTLYATFLDIFMEVLTKNQVFFNSNLPNLDEDLKTVISRIETVLQTQIVGVPQLLKKLAILKLITYSILNNSNLIEELLASQSILSYSYEYVETILNMTLLILDYDNVKAIASDMEISDPELFHVRTLFDDATLASLKVQLLDSKTLPVLMKEIVVRNIYHVCTIKAYTISSYSMDCIQTISCQDQKSGSVELIQYFVDASKNQANQLETAIFKCVNRLIKNTAEFSGFSLKIFYDCAAPEATDDMRLTTVEILSTISSYLLSNDCSALEFVVEFSYLTLLLLRDDSVDVRDECSKMIVNLCSSGSSNVIASYAQEKYLRFLTNLMLKKSFTTVQIVSVLLIVIGLLENSGQDDDSEYRVFDKNEANIFGETFITERLCIEEAKYILKIKNIESLGVSQQSEISKLTQTFCSTNRLEYVKEISTVFEQP